MLHSVRKQLPGGEQNDAVRATRVNQNSKDVSQRTEQWAKSRYSCVTLQIQLMGLELGLNL